MSLFPVCCYTCRKVINPYYEPFRAKVRAIQSEAAAGAATSGEGGSAAAPLSDGQQKDMVAGALSSLGIHNLCCRIIFLSFVDSEMDELANRGEHLGEGIFAKTAGELSGTVRVIRAPSGGRRLKPSVLLAR